jgi:UDPglucose 6-dehydrogenase
MTNIAVIGTGYVGTVTATCFAYLGHRVAGVDAIESRVAQLAAGEAPFYEPGLDTLLRETVATGRLRFTASMADGLAGADVVFLCVGTPLGPGGLPDLSQIEGALQSMAPHLPDDVVIVNKSTVPVGSGNWVRSLLEDLLPPSRASRFSVVSNPEFLREASAIDDFLYPDRIVLGGENGARERVAALYAQLVDQSFRDGRRYVRPEVILTDLPSAEIIKYASNAFLAAKISLANEIATVCEVVGADARQVLPAIGADRRIGRAFLGAGVGWGGSCFGKDVAALIATGSEYGQPMAMLRATVDVNEAQRAAVIRKLQHVLKVLKGRRIGLLGLSFKAGTDDVRDSPGLDLARRLRDAGAVVTVTDPVVKQLPADLADVRIATDAYEAAARADAVVVATDWPEFAALDMQALALVMSGSTVLDGRNLLDVAQAQAAGLTIIGMGW